MYPYLYKPSFCKKIDGSHPIIKHQPSSYTPSYKWWFWVCPLFRVCPLCVESRYLPTVGIKKIGHDRFCFRNRFFQTLKSIFYKSSYVLLNYRCDVVWNFGRAKISRYVGYPYIKKSVTFFPYKMLAFGSVHFHFCTVLVGVLYCGRTRSETGKW